MRAVWLLLSLAGLAAAQGSAPGGKAPRPRIALVIDDFGLTYKKNVPDEDWYKLDLPMTYAVMPESPRTREAARRVPESKHELIVHFPFDPFLDLALPKDRLDPEDLRKAEALLGKALSQIPGPVGLNNHRSLRATTNRPFMAAFMSALKRRGVYFLDSGVSSKTVAMEEARRAGIPSARNVVFLEDGKHHDKEFAARMLRRGAAYARRHGSAVVIGHHYYHGTYEAIVQEAPRLKAEGFDFVFASAVVSR